MTPSSPYDETPRRSMTVRGDLLDAMCDFLDASKALIAAVEEARDAYAAGYDAGVCAVLEIDAE